MTHRYNKSLGSLLICTLALTLNACTFIKNYSKPSSDEPSLSSEHSEDLRCKGANTEYWNDAANTKVSHIICRANLGLIDAASVESARKNSPTQAGLVFMGNISQSNKEISEESLIEVCDKNRGESLIMLKASVGLKDEVIFCRFSDGSILEGRTLFFGAFAPGYTDLAAILD